MSLSLAQRRDAIKRRLDEAYGNTPGSASFDVRLTRQAKHTPRGIRIAWVVYPFEAEVQDALGDLSTDDVIFERRQTWACGGFHNDAMEAWKEHEGRDFLEYDRDDCCSFHLSDKVLPEHVREELAAAGETFQSSCVPGNFVRCPTCGGGSRILRNNTLTWEPCPDCTRLGIDRSMLYPGILNLDVPEHRDLFDTILGAARHKITQQASREATKRNQALALPTTTSTPTWQPLPTRDAGLLNGLPVATTTHCDYLNHADDPEHRILCTNNARWFDPTTGLRVCTRHKNRK